MGSEMQSPWSPDLCAPGVPPGGLCEPPLWLWSLGCCWSNHGCGCPPLAVRMDPRALCELLRVLTLHSWTPPTGSGVCRGLLLQVPLGELLGLCSGPPGVLVLGPLGESLVQVDFRCWLCPALGCLFGTMK